MSKILQGGRLKPTRKDVIKFTSSINSDKRLVDAVIKINQAHVIMLIEQKIIERQDGAKLLQALSQLTDMKLDTSVEDVHAAIEDQVIDKAGSEIGGNIHIAKSRNDQVSTAIRMELRNSLIDLMLSVVNLEDAFIELAEKHVKTIVPGYTHLQPAQPVTFAHYLLSYVDMFGRDFQRLNEAYERVDQCPMGAGALATSSFPIHRDRVAELLGFTQVLENSIDAVGSRDYILETLAVLTILAVNLSRFAEDIIVWSSSDYGLIELPDDFSSTSSIMPQKKNPEILEVIRARTSHILGSFVASATAVKALPSSYNLDFQEITPLLWESISKVSASLDMLSKLMPNLKVNKDASDKLLLSFSTATELANMLVRKYKVPFRIAHKIVGSLVRTLIEKKSTISDVNPELLKKAALESAGLELKVDARDLRESSDLFKFVKAHRVRGGPSPIEVERMIKIRRKFAIQSKSNLSEKKHGQNKAEEKLQTAVKVYSSLKEPSTKLKS
jgi:argininosuccinate lyase